MQDFFKEILKIQSILGVNTSFDFTTGKDFFKKNDIQIEDKENESETKTTENEIIDVEKNISSFEDNENNDRKKQKEIDLSHISTFDDLVKEIQNFNGCDLKRHARNTVIFDGNKNAKIMLIGEAPGEKEDEQGIPFCGQSGQLLRKALSCINLDTTNLLITNTVYWRPPQNRKPTEEEIETCKPFLLKMISIIRPTIIILCGATAIESILKVNKKMSEITGKSQTININFNDAGSPCTFKVFPIYHPSFLLRQPGMKKTFWKHLLILQDELNNNLSHN